MAAACGDSACAGSGGQLVSGNTRSKRDASVHLVLVNQSRYVCFLASGFNTLPLVGCRVVGPSALMGNLIMMVISDMHIT
jgi:hypothetical protein